MHKLVTSLTNLSRKMTKPEVKTISLPYNDNSKYGNVILTNEGVYISLRSNNPFSNSVASELIKFNYILVLVTIKDLFYPGGPNYTLKLPHFPKKISINDTDLNGLKKFVDEVNSRISEVKTNANTPNQTLGEKLKEAKELLDVGTLSQEEFD